MQMALSEARKAYDKGEVPVGCVIVHNQQVIARAHNLVQYNKNPNAHAEILAINEACQYLNSKNLAECNLYVTLEPCTMCASAISNARIKGLYYGAADAKQGAVENGVQFFAAESCMHRPEIYSGLMHQESEELLLRFFAKLRNS